MSARFKQSFWEALKRSAARSEPVAIVQWNGLGLAGRTATTFARSRGISTLYLELGNIEPKTFADPLGVGAGSWLAGHAEILDRTPVEDEEIETWKAGLIERRRAARSIPQARLLLSFNPWFVIDKVARVLMRAPYAQRRTILGRLADKARLLLRRGPPPLAPPKGYVFLPLQVSSDSNLLIHSAHNNLSALDHAAAQAAERGLSLVVKPHPADPDRQSLAEIARRCAQAGHLLTSCNTMELVLGAEAVVTINSTVGMEAKALGKPVIILGRSLYAEMTPRQIAVFALRRLVDFPPFGREPASEAAVDQFLALIGDPFAEDA